jgi:hypothetical protein
MLLVGPSVYNLHVRSVVLGVSSRNEKKGGNRVPEGWNRFPVESLVLEAPKMWTLPFSNILVHPVERLSFRHCKK